MLIVSEETAVSYGPNGEIILSPNLRRGPVGQVPVVGVLMIVQGVLELAFMIVYALLALFGLKFFSWMTASDPTLEGWTEDKFNQFSLLVFGGMALGLGVLSAMRIYSGWKTIHYQQRDLAKLVLKFGFATIVLGFYPFPTALMLGIYGLNVVNDVTVGAAYDVAAAGYSPKQVREIFGRLP